MDEVVPRIPQRRNPSYGDQVPEMSGEEAMAVYRAWRRRVIGDKDTRAQTMIELCVQLREPDNFH